MCDQYQWKINDGTKKLPRSKPVIIKYYHRMDKSGVFQRHGWWLIANPDLILVHYIGDHTSYIPQPHGNAKSSTRPFIRTCPSVITTLKTNDERSHISTYQKQQVDCPPELVPVMRPRDPKQVANSQNTARREARLTHDDIYNLTLLAHELDGFIMEIVLLPDLTFYAGKPAILQEFNRMLELETDGDKLYCTYDTTFNMGDFYVTPIVFRHILFESAPAVPLCFMVHQRKFQSLHEQFL
jgi:hypothetical protein